MRTCPICKKDFSEFPALSRTDNKTEICSLCETQEAINEYCADKKTSLE